MSLRRLLLSILEAVFTVSPNKQYRGIVLPTTPATTGPVYAKNRRLRLRVFLGIVSYIAFLHISYNMYSPQYTYSMYLDTRIYPNPQGQFLIRQMPNSESFDGRQEVECHGRDLLRMTSTVTDRLPTGHHICIPYSLHLPEK